MDADWVDPVVGTRLSMPVLENFDFILRGDIGGFGISSDFTALVSAGLQYHFTRMVSLDIRYKALWVDYETGTQGRPGYFSYTTVTHGPILGLVFAF